MNINKFASLVSWLTHVTGEEFYEDRVNELYGRIVASIEPVPVSDLQVNPDVLDALLALLQEGTYKIEAIRYYRMMTGAGLKESKDAIEKYWVSKVDQS